MRFIDEILIFIVVIMIVSIFALSIIQNIGFESIKSEAIQQKVGQVLLKTFNIVDYGIKDKSLYVYLKPESPINLSNIKVLVNGKNAIVREIGNGDGIVTRNEMIEIIYSPVLPNQTRFNIFVSGQEIVPSSWTIDVEKRTITPIKTTSPTSSYYCTRLDWIYPYNTCRIPINISYIRRIPNFEVNLTIDTASLIAQGKMRPDCGDIRFSVQYPYEGSNYTSDNLVLGYHFDEGFGNITYDYSGLSNNGTIYNASWTSGKFNNALNFTGDYNSYVFTNYSNPLYLPNNFSIVAWIKPLDYMPERTALFWWNDSWNYRIPITIQENSGTTLTDYQVNFTIDTASLIAQGKMRPDCGDIRFTYYDSVNNTEVEIPYWIESGCNTTSTKIWVKVPYIPANGKVTVYMYYGNPSATSESNPHDVFDFFDHFDSLTLDTTKWNTTNNGTYEISNSWITFGGNWSKRAINTTVDFSMPLRVRAKIRFPVDYINYTHYGGSLNDSFVSVLSDNGTLYIAGYEESNTFGGRDALVTSFYNNSTLRWQVNIGGSYFETAYKILKLPNGDYLVIGQENSIPFIQGWRVSYIDGLLSEVDPYGNIVGTYHLGYASYATDIYDGVYGTTSNQLYVAGYVYGSSTGGWDAYIAAIDPTTWTINWDYFIGSTYEDGIMRIATDYLPTTGEVVYAVGATYASTGGANPDGLVLALDSTGTVLWQKYIGGIGWDILFGVTVDNAHNIYVLGRENSTTTGDYDILIAKIAPNGTLLWQKAIGNDSVDDCIYGTIKYYNGYLYIACDVADPYGNFDGYVSKLDTNGNIIWQKLVSGIGDEQLNDLTIDGNYLYVVGRETSNSYGDNDGILLKINLSSIPKYNVYFDDNWKLRFINATLNIYNTTLLSGNPGLTSTAAGFRIASITLSYGNPGLNYVTNYSDYSIYISFNTYSDGSDYTAYGTLTKNQTIVIGGSKQVLGSGISVFKPHIIESIFTPNYFISKLDDRIVYNVTGIASSTFGPIGIAGMSEAQMDWIAICKYISPEPNVTLGYEEMRAAVIIKKGKQFGIFAGNGYIYSKVGQSYIKTPFSLNSWQSVILVYNGTNMSLYINGTLVGTTYAANVGTITNITIGREFKGIIDEIRIYNRTLSSTEIKLIGLGLLEKKIPYFLEQENCNTNYTHVYTKVPELTNGTIRIYMYYCNPNALSESNGYKVFEFFDDFNNNLIDSWWTPENNALWTESGTIISSNPTGTFSVKPLMYNVRTFDNVIIKAKGRWTSTNDDLGIFIYGDTLGDAYALWHGYGTPPNSQYCIARYSAYSSPYFIVCYPFDLQQNQWGFFEVEIKNNGEIRGRIWVAGDPDPPWTLSTTVTPYGKYIGIWYWNDRCYVDFDWIFVRKSIDPWFTSSFGTEEICTS